MRAKATPEQVIRAVVKAISKTFDRGKWMELGLETGTLDYIQDHSRLLRSLRRESAHGFDADAYRDRFECRHHPS